MFKMVRVNILIIFNAFLLVVLFASEVQAQDVEADTSLILKDDAKLITGDDLYQRVQNGEQKAVIFFKKDSTQLDSSELGNSDLINLESFFRKTSKNPGLQVKRIKISSYVPPYFSTEDVTNIGRTRNQTGKLVAMRIMKEAGFNFEIRDDLFEFRVYGEDFHGFKELIKASNYKDKDLIIRILEMYSDPRKRESELISLGKASAFIENEILPKMHRSIISVEYNEFTSDAELIRLAEQSPDSLLLEELLFAATLFNGIDPKLKLYLASIKNGTADSRVYNNAGVAYWLLNNSKEAKLHFESAISANSSVIPSNNLGVIAMSESKHEAAKEYFEKAEERYQEAKYNLGLINLWQGEYGEAISQMGSFNTYNKALASYFYEDYDEAVRIIENSDDLYLAKSFYLQSLIYARLNDVNRSAKMLEQAIAKDNLLKIKAANDKTFSIFSKDRNFMRLVHSKIEMWNLVYAKGNLPYVIGADVYKLLQDGVDLLVDFQLIYVHKVSGEQIKFENAQEFTASNIWQDSMWEYRSKTQKIIQEGVPAKIQDFSLSKYYSFLTEEEQKYICNENNGFKPCVDSVSVAGWVDLTDYYLTKKGCVAIIVIPNVDSTNLTFKEMALWYNLLQNEDVKTVIATGSNKGSFETYLNGNQMEYNHAYCDQIEISKIFKQKAGVVFLSDGVIIGLHPEQEGGLNKKGLKKIECIVER